MPAKLAEADQMTIEELPAFGEARPDGERWELIEGVAVLTASPTQWHRIITGNLLASLFAQKAAMGADGVPVLGVGTKVPVSPNSLPQADLYVQDRHAAGSPVTDDALVIFEVLSRSNTKADEAWRSRVYASVPSCQHYVTIATKSAEAVRYDRASGWQAATSRGLADNLSLLAISVTTPLSGVYRWTPIKRAILPDGAEALCPNLN